MKLGRADASPTAARGRARQPSPSPPRASWAVPPLIVPWPATAGPAPPPAARCRAPDTAGRHGCRTAGRGYGRSDSASRRSGGARTGVLGSGPARVAPALIDPRAGREGDLPGPARRPAPHEVSPPLAWLPGSDQPTELAGTAQPERIADSPYSPAMGPAGHGLVRRAAPRRRPTRPAPWQSRTPR